MYYSNFSSLIAILSLILFSFSSCSKEVTLDTGEEVVVVECILSCDSIQHLNLAYTHPKSQKAGTQVISEAQVTLFDETTNTSAGAFQFLNNSWTLSYSAIPLHTYRLDIGVPGHDHIFARQTMPDQVRIWSFLWSMWSNQAGVPISDIDYGLTFWEHGYQQSHIMKKKAHLLLSIRFVPTSPILIISIFRENFSNLLL